MAKYHERTRRFRALVIAHQLSMRDVARLLDRAEITVTQWHSQTNEIVIPKHMLELLTLKLGGDRA